MPTPKIYSEMSELQNDIKSYSTESSLKLFLAHKIEPLQEIVRLSVTGNTFRAFRFRQYIEAPNHITPSGLYRSWVVNQFATDLKKIEKINSFESMTDYIVEIANKLNTHWNESTGHIPNISIGFGRAAKLLNLSMKHMLWLDGFNKSNLQHSLNVPLDSFTIQALTKICPDLKIPKGATMAFIDTEDRYRQFQVKIKLLTREFEKYPLHYEIATWNAAHAASEKSLKSE